MEASMSEEEAQEAWHEAVIMAEQVLRSAKTNHAIDPTVAGGLAERVLAVNSYHRALAAAAVEESDDDA
jgi:hypothetical protein